MLSWQLSIVHIKRGYVAKHSSYWRIFQNIFFGPLRAIGSAKVCFSDIIITFPGTTVKNPIIH